MKKETCLIAIILFFFFSFSLYSSDFVVRASIESVRNGRILTVLFQKKPASGNYLIIDDERIIGRFDLLNVLELTSNGWRAVGRGYVRDKKYSYLLRAGTQIALSRRKKALSDSFKRKTYYKETLEYKKEIILLTDNRKMVLIPSGKFYFGSNSGDKDEYPGTEKYTGAFYIDRYEVSNRDYKRFAEKTNRDLPGYWRKEILDTRGNFRSNFLADIPVRVTYYEALAFARWAGKRLPSEEEWEKAARGLKSSKLPDRDYPWGNTFSPDKANSIEFWQSEAGAVVKQKHGIRGLSLMPVYSFSDKGISPFGVVNMSGNVPEWTSGWYLPYKGNNNKKNSYGKQYRVIRGGAWYENHRSLRVSNRERGGIPSLRLDRSAGFRCVKEPGLSDRQYTN